MSNQLKTAACYIRVSTNKQEELSPDSQLKEIKKYAKSNGYILLSDYIFMEEEGISGKRADNRREFQRMIATAKQKPKPFDVILVWKYSRFARNQDESTFYKGMLRKKCGIDIISISEPIIEGMYGRLIEMVIEWSDEFYSVNLSSEVMRGMTEKAQRGGYQSAVPFGYIYDKTSKIPIIDSKAAEIVQTIFSWFVDDQRAVYDIARQLNLLGIHTRSGNTWEMRSIRYILENPFYIGKIRWNRQHHESHTIKDKSEWIISEGSHEPIISEEQFNAAQERIEKISRKTGSRPASTKKHWLSGIVKCSNCGSSLFVGAKDKHGNVMFQCGGYLKGKCHVSHGIMESRLTSAIIDGLTELCSSDTEVSYQKLKKSDTSDTYSLLQKQLEALTQKEHRIRQAYINGIDSLEEYKENKELLQKEKDSLTLQIKEYFKPKNNTVIDFKLEIRNVVDIISSHVEDSVKSEALHSIVDKIIYYKSEDCLNFELVYYE
ncbi:MAG: recombinase family protein [Lachnospiraceae bacterium]|nr:recombinase family protein [Lachnospiraceae bacterium]